MPDLANLRCERCDAQETLRDRFAMAALTGMLADPSDGSEKEFYSYSGFVAFAYRYADAMLAERERKP